uniref:Uncharacterized protein n=1 Tax=Romanomermis culicivorax TaxID=13658 RepID=A0A915KKA3_ROMCU
MSYGSFVGHPGAGKVVIGKSTCKSKVNDWRRRHLHSNRAPLKDENDYDKSFLQGTAFCNIKEATIGRNYYNPDNTRYPFRHQKNRQPGKWVEIVERIVRKSAAWFFSFPTDIYEIDEKSTNEQKLFQLPKFMGEKMTIPASKIGEIKVDWIGIFTSRNGQNRQVCDKQKGKAFHKIEAAEREFTMINIDNRIQFALIKSIAGSSTKSFPSGDQGQELTFDKRFCSTMEPYKQRAKGMIIIDSSRQLPTFDDHRQLLSAKINNA